MGILEFGFILSCMMDNVALSILILGSLYLLHLVFIIFKFSLVAAKSIRFQAVKNLHLL